MAIKYNKLPVTHMSNHIQVKRLPPPKYKYDCHCRLNDGKKINRHFYLPNSKTKEKKHDI